MIQTMSHQYFLIKIMEKLLSLHTEDVSPHRRCVLNCHKRQKEKLGKSGNKTMQNYLSIDTTQMLIMSKK